ncbi:MAG: ATP-binding protein [Bacteroidales bacterium]|nr:ATP-binding protein [Bacteroidales bacterium]
MNRIFQYRSHIQEIPRIRKDLEFLEQEWAIPKSEIRQILVIIEELFSNIIRYAFDDNREHIIDIRLVNSENQIEIEMIDDGIPFNPLEYQMEPLADPATSDAGGMGLTLIRAFSSNISYHRSSGKNHLKVTKKVKHR